MTSDFFIMSGDCDGDILGASIQNGIISDHYITLTQSSVISTDKQFKQLKNEWDSLLKKSDNNNLFLTWDWCYTWWSTFSRKHDFKLKIVTTWKNNELIGIAPLYLRKYTLYGFTIKQLQLIGCSWSGPNTFRSEYLDFIVDQNHKREASVGLIKHVYDEINWDELILGDIREDSLTSRLIQEHYSGGKLLNRTVHQDSSIQIPLTTDLKSYTKDLSANFRRSVFTKQIQLKEKEGVEYQQHQDLSCLSENIISTLNHLHMPRWKKPCFEGASRDFHEQLIAVSYTHLTLPTKA